MEETIQGQKLFAEIQIYHLAFCVVDPFVINKKVNTTKFYTNLKSVVVDPLFICKMVNSTKFKTKLTVQVVYFFSKTFLLVQRTPLINMTFFSRFWAAGKITTTTAKNIQYSTLKLCHIQIGWWGAEKSWDEMYFVNFDYLWYSITVLTLQNGPTLILVLLNFSSWDHL